MTQTTYPRRLQGRLARKVQSCTSACNSQLSDPQRPSARYRKGGPVLLASDCFAQSRERHPGPGVGTGVLLAQDQIELAQ